MKLEDFNLSLGFDETQQKHAEAKLKKRAILVDDDSNDAYDNDHAAAEDAAARQPQTQQPA